MGALVIFKPFPLLSSFPQTFSSLVSSRPGLVVRCVLRHRALPKRMLSNSRSLLSTDTPLQSSFVRVTPRKLGMKPKLFWFCTSLFLEPEILPSLFPSGKWIVCLLSLTLALLDLIRSSRPITDTCEFGD